MLARRRCRSFGSSTPAVNPCSVKKANAARASDSKVFTRQSTAAVCPQPVPGVNHPLRPLSGRHSVTPRAAAIALRPIGPNLVWPPLAICGWKRLWLLAGSRLAQPAPLQVIGLGLAIARYESTHRLRAKRLDGAWDDQVRRPDGFAARLPAGRRPAKRLRAAADVEGRGWSLRRLETPPQCPLLRIGLELPRGHNDPIHRQPTRHEPSRAGEGQPRRSTPPGVTAHAAARASLARDSPAT